MNIIMYTFSEIKFHSHVAIKMFSHFNVQIATRVEKARKNSNLAEGQKDKNLQEEENLGYRFFFRVVFIFSLQATHKFTLRIMSCCVSSINLPNLPKKKVGENLPQIRK
jgi:hypothetical protein